MFDYTRVRIRQAFQNYVKFVREHVWNVAFPALGAVFGLPWVRSLVPGADMSQEFWLILALSILGPSALIIVSFLWFYWRAPGQIYAHQIDTIFELKSAHIANAPAMTAEPRTKPIPHYSPQSLSKIDAAFSEIKDLFHNEVEPLQRSIQIFHSVWRNKQDHLYLSLPLDEATQKIWNFHDAAHVLVGKFNEDIGVKYKTLKVVGDVLAPEEGGDPVLDFRKSLQQLGMDVEKLRTCTGDAIPYFVLMSINKFMVSNAKFTDWIAASLARIEENEKILLGR